MGPLRRVRSMSVAAQILVLQLLVVVVVVAGGLALAYVDARRDGQTRATQTVVAVAHSVADSPYVEQALATADPTGELQPYAEQVRADTGTDFVVIMTPAGRRWTHPDVTQIGGAYRGSIEQAAAGQVHVENYTGTLGPSVRAVLPVWSTTGDRRVVGLVAVGVTTANIERSLLPSLPPILLAAAGVLAVGSIGAWLVSRRLRRQTHGLGSGELTRMVEYYDAVLHAVREGLVLTDDRDRVVLVNDEARRLLGWGEDVVGRRLDELSAAPAWGQGPLRDEVQLVGPRVLVVNRAPATWRGRTLGTATTLRDQTELRAVSGELDSVRSLAESLRSQNHEAANRLHTVVSLIELDRPGAAIEFATRELEVAQRLTDRVVTGVGDPILAALLLGKTAQAAERGIDLTVSADGPVEEHGMDSGDLVTVLGNLIDNAMEATTETGRRREVAVAVRVANGRLELVVGDSGPGVPSAALESIFERGWSSKAGSATGLAGRGIGLALVVQAVGRLGGAITVDTAPAGGAQFTVRIPNRSVVAR